MIGKMALNICVQQENTIRVVNPLSCDLKKGLKMEASVIETPLHDNKFLLKFYFLKGTYIKA